MILLRKERLGHGEQFLRFENCSLSPILEHEPKLSFELAMLVALALDRSERSIVINAQARAARCGMVKNVGGIHTDLHSFRFTDTNRLTHGRVEGPLSGQFHGLPADRTPLSRLRILKKNLACVGVGNRLQAAVWLEAECGLGALRIRDFSEGIVVEEAPKITIPLNVSKGLRPKRADNIRDAIPVPHVARTDTGGLSGT